MFFLKKHEKGLLVFLKFFTVLAAAVFSYVMTRQYWPEITAAQEWLCLLASLLSALFAAVIVFRNQEIERLLPNVTVAKAAAALIFTGCTVACYSMVVRPDGMIAFVGAERYAASRLLHLFVLYSPAFI